MKRILVLFFLLAAVGLSAQNSVNKPFSFAYLSDIHIAEGTSRIDDAITCVNDINSLPQIKFVIIAGDITEFGADEEIQTAKNIFDKLKVPYYIVAGNHDAKWSESGCNTFVKVFGYEGFNFDYGGIKFIGCNSGPNMRMAPALVPRETIVWLDSLSRKIDPTQPVFFVNHYPMDTSVLNYTQVLDKLKSINTQFILNGHWHQDRAMVYEGIPAAIGRSTQRAGKDGPGYNIITVNGSLVTMQERVADIIKDDKSQKRAVTKSPWLMLRISNGAPYNTDIHYPRPDYSCNNEYPNVKTVWRIEERADIGAGAVESNSNVIYTTTAGNVVCIDGKNGQQRWNVKLGGKIFSTPAVSGNIVVVGCTDNYIYGLDIFNGDKKWSYKCGKSVMGAVNICKGVAYIGASDHTFRAINVKTGKLLWENREVKGFIEAKAFVDNEQVVVGDWANRLYSFNTKNGKTQWIWQNKGSRMFSPAAVWPVKANGRIFFVTPERYSYAVDAKTGKQLFREYGGRESIGLSPDKSTYYVKVMKDSVFAFSTLQIVKDKEGVAHPKSVWRVSADFHYEIAPTPMVSTPKGGKDGKGLLFVPTDKGNIVALNLTDGSIAWRHKVSFALINSILPLPDNKLLVCTMDGIVTLLQY